jgi:dipeptidyl-peptidase 4
MKQLQRIAAITIVAAAVGFGPSAWTQQQAQPRTWQEEQNFRSGPTPFEPLMKFWYDLERMTPLVSIRPLTRTLLDREFTLVTVSKDPVANAAGRHPFRQDHRAHRQLRARGETAGKEASQLVARELVFGDLNRLLDDVIVLFVPLINPDGGEVRRRTNEEGFDMNRDYIKLESQEIYALVTKVLNEWTPDIHIDTHHGGSAPYTLTWQGTLNPAADAELRAYPYDHIFPRMREALRAEGYDGFDYSGPQTRDGVRGWGSTSVEPRKHHVYTGLVNSIGILFETPSSAARVRSGAVEPIPQEERYWHQVRGQVIGMTAVLRHAAERRTEIRALTNASRERAIRAGANPTEAVAVPVEYRLVSRGTEPVWMPEPTAGGPGRGGRGGEPGQAGQGRGGAAAGGQGGRGGGQPVNYRLENVPVWLRYEVTRTVPRARGYVIPASIAKVVPLLLDHGLRVHRFTEPVELELEVYDAKGVRRNEYFQGHYLKSVAGVEKRTDKVQVPAGWFFVSTAQSKGNLISYIMEPETDDNLITWGYTDNVLQVAPATIEEAMAGMLGDNDPSSLTPEQRQQLEERAKAMINRTQRVPMMRLVREQPMPLLEVTRFTELNRTRYWGQ